MPEPKSGNQTVLTDPDPTPAPDPTPDPTPDPAPDATPPDPGTPPAEPPAPDAGNDPEPKPADEPDGKKKDQDPPKQRVVPEKYDLTLPEGSRLSDEAVEGLSGLARDLELDNDQAQRLIEASSERLEVYRTEERARWNEITEGWRESLPGIPEIGGENGADLEDNLVLARRAMAEFGNDELMQGLEDSGYGNWPPLLKMLVQLGKSLEEDGVGGIQVRATVEPKTRAQKLYPEHPSKPL